MGKMKIYKSDAKCKHTIVLEQARIEGEKEFHVYCFRCDRDMIMNTGDYSPTKEIMWERRIYVRKPRKLLDAYMPVT